MFSFHFPTMSDVAIRKEESNALMIKRYHKDFGNRATLTKILSFDRCCKVSAQKTFVLLLSPPAANSGPVRKKEQRERKKRGERGNKGRIPRSRLMARSKLCPDSDRYLKMMMSLV